jgi:uncharacterized protein YjbI with pentapeptide repeats
MLLDLLEFIRRRFAAFCAALLVPATGVWFTYWERDQSQRESVRAQLEAVSQSYTDFIGEISKHLLNRDFGYLELYDNIDRVNFKAFIEREAKRHNQKVPALESLSSGRDNYYLQSELPDKTLSEIFGAKLNLLFESLRNVDSLDVGSGRATKLARETLHFLRRTGLLDFGGLFNTEADLSGLDLRYLSIPCSSLYELRINGTNFSGANLTAANLHSSTDFKGVDFTDSILMSTWLGKGIFTNTKFDSANLQLASLKEASFEDSTFERADMRQASLFGARILKGNSFRYADMRGAILLFDKAKSIDGQLFKGAFANSKPFRLDDDTSIPSTVIPDGLSFDDLGLIDITPHNSSDLKRVGVRDGENGRDIYLPESCKWKVDGNLALIAIYRKLSGYTP